MIELKGIRKAYGESVLFEDLSISLHDGSKTVITGASGCGKTTLLRIIAGLEAADAGKVTCPTRQVYMFQEPRLLPSKNVLDNIRAVLKKEDFALADKYLGAVGLLGDEKKFPRELSGGMAQRVAFARLLAFAEATDAELLLLDEPFSALDKETASKMLELLKAFSATKTLLLVTHDEDDIVFADNVIRL